MSGLMGFDEAFRVADLAVRAVRSEGLRDIERVVLEGSWNRHTYHTIASKAGYTEGYLSRDVGPALWDVLSKALGVQVKKTNFRTAIERWSEQTQLDHADFSLTAATNGSSAAASLPPVPSADALPFDITDFRGREAALSTLVDWIVEEHGRLLCLSGLPGVGKSWFAVKLADHVRKEFQRFIYEDLRDRSSPSKLVNTLLNRLEVASTPADSLTEQLDLLVHTLTVRPSLIVLDQTETLCCPQTLAGVYEPEFIDYQEVLRVLASREHQSCLIWVGRELPRATSAIAGSSCQRYWLDGLLPEEIASLAVWPDSTDATPAAWQQLSHDYGGLPSLILGEIAPRLPSFGHRLDNCLTALAQEKRWIYGYVEAWLASLSAPEWQVLTWMLISQRPLSSPQLNAYLGATIPFTVLESLCDRGICRALRRAEPTWELTLPDLLRPYLYDRWLTAFFKASEPEQMAWLSQYALIQANAPEMVRQWQRETLLSAIAAHFEAQYPTAADKQRFLVDAFQVSQVAPSSTKPDYRPGNLINLAHYWQIPLLDIDLHGLTLQGADLQSDLFQGLSVAGADLTQTLLAKPMGQSPVIALNPQREEVAVGDQDGRLLLWDLQTGRLQRAMLSVSQAIRAIAFSPDGQILAEGRQDGTVCFWDLSSDLGPEQFADYLEEALTTLAFSPDKSLLVGGDEVGTLYVWRIASGEEVHRIPAHIGGITAIAFSPCGKRLLSCGQDCAAVEWDLATGASLKRFQGRLTNLLGAVAYRPSLAAELVQAVVVGRDESQLIVWDMASARPQYIMNEPCETFMSLALSADGRYLAASDVSNTVSVWNVESRSRLCQITQPSAPVESLVFNPNRAELMTGCDYTVQQWEIPSGQCLRIWRSNRHPARQLALSTTPLQVLSSHDDHTLRSWQFSEARQRWLPQTRLQIPTPNYPKDAVRVIVSSQSPAYWAVGMESGHIYVWHRASQTWLTWSIRLPKPITAMAFSPEGTRLAAGDATGTVALWDLAQQTFHWQKDQVHGDQVMTLTFAPDGQQVYSGSRDRTIRAWDIKGTSRLTLEGHRRRVHTLKVSIDGRHLYSGSQDGTVRTWQISNGALLDDWQQHDTAYILDITLDAQNRPIAIISDTQTLAFWDIESHTCRATCAPDEETLWHVSTSPDGESLVCARQNGEISLWSLTSGQQQGKLRLDRPYEGMQIGGCLGLTEPERQMLYSLGASDY